MIAGARVAKQRKPKAKGAGAAENEEKFTEPVKLRKSFKKKLQRLAVDAGIEMGEIVERQMRDFIDREILRLAARDAGEA